MTFGTGPEINKTAIEKLNAPCASHQKRHCATIHPHRGREAGGGRRQAGRRPLRRFRPDWGSGRFHRPERPLGGMIFVMCRR